jgi:hypothetical protein
LRVFKTKVFALFARRERISDASLRDAVRRAERGLVDADLGGGVLKQRVARPGEERSGGYRVPIAYRANTRSVFLLASPRASATISTTMNWQPCATSPKDGSRQMRACSPVRWRTD